MAAGDAVGAPIVDERAAVSEGVCSVSGMSSAAGQGTGGPVLPAWVGTITDAELDRLCGTGALTRGREYALAGRVLSLTSADRGRMLLGEVAGTRGEPYSTLVTHAGDTPGGPSWVSRCSCPVGVRC